MDVKKHGKVIEQFNDLNRRLAKFKMHVKSWGRLAVCLDEDPHSGYIINNVDDMAVIEGFVSGLEFDLVKLEAERATQK